MTRNNTPKFPYDNPPCSGGCGKVRSVVTAEDAGKQWLCFNCRNVKHKSETIELFNLNGTILVPTFGDTTGVHNQINALQRFAVAAPCWRHDVPFRWTREVVEA